MENNNQKNVKALNELNKDIVDLQNKIMLEGEPNAQDMENLKTYNSIYSSLLGIAMTLSNGQKAFEELFKKYKESKK